MGVMMASLIRRILCSSLIAVLCTGAASAASAPRVAIETSAGTIVVQLEPKRAPRTTKNFLHLVDFGSYTGASFYRTVSKKTEAQSHIEVIQGGLGQHVSPVTIPLEGTDKTGLHNTDGVISMARTRAADSASSEFFICVGDNTWLDAQQQGDHLGYAAFGHVVRGMDVVLKINHAAANGETLTPPVTILRMKRV
ncbi:MAG: peptidylprolyl isomerase [Candidatus Velthaea sp.]